MKKSLKIISVFLTVILLGLQVFSLSASAGTTSGSTISYSFTSDKAGYAEGTVTFSAGSAGDYKLYWADDAGKLSGFYPMKEYSFSSAKTKMFSFGYHTAIPYRATRIIAVDGSGNTVAEYVIPYSKRLSSQAGNLRYKFNAYSDLHINIGGYFYKATERFEQGLQYGVDTDTDFIVITGDVVTNKTGLSAEWKSYEKTLSQSSYVNPVWEAVGNHDLKNDAQEGLKAFVRGSGTDNTAANYDANKPYYTVTEKNSGDIFIFMALENTSGTSDSDEFSSAQMTWVTNLIEQNYQRGVNIYICEHSPIKGFGAGDRMNKPYNNALLSQSFASTKQFKALLQQYPGLIFLSGHTHEDLEMNYNFSDENGAACSMIHVPCLAGTTMPDSKDSDLDYNDGKGFHSQGYLVEAYDNEVVFYGANIADKLIYPAYTYIMEGYSSGASVQETTSPTVPSTSPETTAPETTAPVGYETKRVYFANTLNWKKINCHSWPIDATSDVTCVWPGYPATRCGTDENGIDLYYVDIPADHTGIIWNNGAGADKTVNIPLDGTNNFFVPPAGQSGKKITVDSYVWSYEEPTTEPATTSPVTVYQKGDVNKDGKITIDDATAVQKHLAELISLGEEEQRLADVNESNNISVKDVTEIQRFVAEIITEFMPVNALPKSSPAPVGAADYKQTLDSFYTFSSYDQYQALKKLYYSGGSGAELSAAAAELKAITDHINGTASCSYRDTYYFENTKDWSVVYGYAWNGSSKNAEWPGVQLSKVGTNSGHDVYKVKFDSAGQYTKLIFDAGSGSSQTVNIDLSAFANNAFYVSGKDSDGKYTVGNFSFSE